MQRKKANREKTTCTQFHLHDNTRTDPREIWMAVLLQAVQDATSTSQEQESVAARHQARRWLLAGGSDFHAVCELAGVNAANFRTKLFSDQRQMFGWARYSQPNKTTLTAKSFTTTFKATERSYEFSSKLSRTARF